MRPFYIMNKYELVAKVNNAKSATFTTVDGVIETPCFMNVGTVGAIKGGVSTDDLKNAFNSGNNDLGKSSGFDQALNDFANSSAKADEKLREENQKNIQFEEK